MAGRNNREFTRDEPGETMKEGIREMLQERVVTSTESSGDFAPPTWWRVEPVQRRSPG